VRASFNLATALPRAEAIQTFEAACQAQGLDILDFKAFSNLSLSVQFEGNAGGLVAALKSLQTKAYILAASSQDELARLGTVTPGTEIQGTLQVTFALGDGSMEVTVPAVPG
jgi:hypothetical protein